MGLIIDGIIILFILLSIFFGYKKGLISLGINLVAFIITIVAVMIFYRPIGNIIINTTTIDEKIQETIQGNVEEIARTEETNEITSGLIESAKQGVLPEASKSLARNIVYGATMIILFIIIRVALIFVTAIANLVAKLPVLNEINKVGGIVYGLLRGFSSICGFDDNKFNCDNQSNRSSGRNTTNILYCKSNDNIQYTKYIFLKRLKSLHFFDILAI